MRSIPFVNRGSERKKLKEVLSRSSCSLVVIYGKRRVGKSELIKHVINKNDIYFLSAKKEIRTQIKDFANLISKKIEGFGNVEYPNICTLLESLNRTLSDKTTLVIDEFNYMIESSSGIVSEINTFWETTKDKKLNIILCGSVRNLMEKVANEYAAPLYGRTDMVMHLKPITPGWIIDALNLDPLTAVEIYSVLGGIPTYWEHAQNNDCRDLHDTIIKLFFEKDAPLKREPELILYDDLKSAVQYYSILSAISNKTLRSSDISNKTGISQTSLSKPLSFLLELKYIEKEVRFLDEPRKAKNTRYRIADPFLSFYYNFVESNRSELEMGLINETWSSIREEINTYISFIWEKLCRQAVPYLKLGEIDWRPASRWWGKSLDSSDMEIDILSESFDGKNILAGEVKWSDNVDFQRELNYLKQRISMMPNFPGNKKVIYAIFAKNTKKAKNFTDCHLIDATKAMEALRR